MDERLRDGRWMQRSVDAARQPSWTGAPIDGDYAAESTEWTPLTRRAAVGSFTPVPVSRRTGLIAGGVVLASGGVGMVGVSAIALTAGLVIGVLLAADRAPAPLAVAAPVEAAGEISPVAAMPEAAAEAPSAEVAAQARSAEVAAQAPRADIAAVAAPTARADASRATAPSAAPVAPQAAARAPVAASPAAPVAVAPVAPVPPAAWAPAPVAPTPEPAAEEGWFAAASRAAADLLGAEEPAVDPLDALVADVAVERSAPAAAPVVAGYAPPPAGDPLAALLAEPIPKAPAPVAAPAEPASGGWMASAAAAVNSGWEAAAPVVAAAAPVVAAAAPVASWSAPAPAAAAPWAPPPAPVAPLPVAPVVAPVVAVAAPALPACVGEFCDDVSASSYRDGASSMDLLAEDGDDWSIDVAPRPAAAQFASVGEPDLDEGGGDLDALDTMLVEIRTDAPGVQVVIDGVVRGVTPLRTDVGAGYHTVKLVSEDGEQSFQLRPQADPETWCFAGRGRSFKLERCR
jgi:hypothetical protein